MPKIKKQSPNIFEEEIPKELSEEVMLPFKSYEYPNDNDNADSEVMESNEETYPEEVEDVEDFSSEESGNEDEYYEISNESTDEIVIQNQKRKRNDTIEEDDLPISKRLRDRTLIKNSNLDDYVMSISNFVSKIKTPTTYNEVLKSEENKEWFNAMNNELNSLKENKTWELVTLPKGCRALPCKWVYRVKTNPDGTVDKFKARLVIKGFNQRAGIDYSETFSPVAKMGTIRALLSLAASKGMHLSQFDVSTAFLYGELEEDIFMKQPDGFEDGTDRVCKLKRSLYGLKQAPRCWNKRFGRYLLQLGFRASAADPCFYIRENNGKKLLLVLYVDDGLIASSDAKDLEDFLKELRSEFKIVTKDADYFLGIQIKRESSQIKISQEAYAKKILERFNFGECKKVNTPMIKSDDQGKNLESEKKNTNFPYRQAVGALLYLMLGTRPDLAYSVGFLSRSLENHTTEDVTRLKRVFRYIAGTIDLGIVYNKDSNHELECYSDADFGGCTTTGRSTSGVVVKYAGGAISWLSQRQTIVATSTTEAEIVAATEATKEIMWLSRLYSDVIQFKKIPVLQVDNTAAVRLSQNPEFHRRTKHIAIKHFFVREKVMERKLDVKQVSTTEQVADIMTKPLQHIRLSLLCSKLGVKSVNSK